MSRDIDDSSENVLSEWQPAEDDGGGEEDAAWGTAVADREEPEPAEQLEPQSLAAPGLETEAPAEETEAPAEAEELVVKTCRSCSWHLQKKQV